MSVIEQTWSWLTTSTNWSGDEGIPALLVQHIRISFYAVLIAAVISMPIAVVLGHIRKGGAIAANIGNVGRAVPTLGVLIIFAVSPIGVTETSAVLALALFAIPPLLTNTYIGVRDVDDELRDAAKGMGMKGRQVLARVELPLATPVIAAGVRTAIVQVVATASLAAVIGGGGLGVPIVVGFGLQDYGQVFGGAVLVAGLCIVTELLLAWLQRVVTPAPLRAIKKSKRQMVVQDVTLSATLP